MNSTEIRAKLVEAVRLDLVGPANDHAFARELLPQSPRRWYLTGFLLPSPLEAKQKAAGDEEMAEDATANSVDGDDTDNNDRETRLNLLPSSMGLSVIVGPNTQGLKAVVRWGDYEWESPDPEAEPEEEAVARKYEEELSKELPVDSTLDAKAPVQKAKPWVRKGYRRIPREASVEFTIRPGKQSFPVPLGKGLDLVVSARPLLALGAGLIPAGSHALSVFLVNNRSADLSYKSFIFQAEIELVCPDGFLGRPDLRGLVAGQKADNDDLIADLHYRDDLEFGVGHGVSAEYAAVEDGLCRNVKTHWMPSAEVERVDHVNPPGVELGMQALGALTSPQAATKALSPLVSTYRDWIAAQETLLRALPLTQSRVDTGEQLLREARTAADRIEAGIRQLERPDVLDAFKTANRAMARSAIRRVANRDKVALDRVAEPKWRAFQLAFILMNLEGLADSAHPDRNVVDLLFFPTGGGKTEAYLGLSAFTLVLRRLRNPGVSSAGVSILMRYTLRLLTLDQLGRAAGLMCALELERKDSGGKLGEWPFEIGLWVGSAATPNRMGMANDKSPGADRSAYSKTTAFKNNPTRRPAPIPIEECPWCAHRFTADSFELLPQGSKRPTDLRVSCANEECEFSAAHNQTLPILGVDEPIYRRLPCFIIATVDKFASLPWTGRVGGLFGHVQWYDADGFYGPCGPKRGKPLPGGSLPPPELIIQDELHLISGPLGTIAGIYEVAIEQLASRTRPDGKVILPKIIASTATVRRANRQIRALFGRAQTAIFPPPGLKRRDSFFSATALLSEANPGRQYLGIAAQGRSMKVILLRAALALLSGGQRLLEREGGPRPDHPADPYMTLLGYFNSLRELGGSRRIVEDEIYTKLQLYWRRQRLDPHDDLFARRMINREPVELTSRVDTNDVASAKRQLQTDFSEKEHVDVALATNMISVGLDITRLGLMLMFGQPKTTSEYIQATSRVGRDRNKPGLVVTLLNIHRPRDRSHYERFAHYHRTFYRSVEATSVTPFSPRALDRALSAALVGLCRLRTSALTPYNRAADVEPQITQLQQLVQVFGERARDHDVDKDVTEATDLQNHVVTRAHEILAKWLKIARTIRTGGAGGLSYQKFEDVPVGTSLLHDFLDPQVDTLAPEYRAFRANRSMRDVGPSVDILSRPSMQGTQS